MELTITVNMYGTDFSVCFITRTNTKDTVWNWTRTILINTNYKMNGCLLVVVVLLVQNNHFDPPQVSVQTERRKNVKKEIMKLDIKLKHWDTFTLSKEN